MPKSVTPSHSTAKRLTVRLSQVNFPAFDALQAVKLSGAEAVQALWSSARTRMARGLLDTLIDQADAQILQFYKLASKAQVNSGTSIRLDLYVGGPAIADKFHALSNQYLLDASNTAKLVLQANHLYESQAQSSAQNRPAYTFEQELAPTAPARREAPEPLAVTKKSGTRWNSQTNHWEILTRTEPDTRMTSAQLKEIALQGGLYLTMNASQMLDHGLIAPVDGNSPEKETISVPRPKDLQSHPLTVVIANAHQPTNPEDEVRGLVDPESNTPNIQSEISVEDALFDSMSIFLQARKVA